MIAQTTQHFSVLRSLSPHQLLKFSQTSTTSLSPPQAQTFSPREKVLPNSTNRKSVNLPVLPSQPIPLFLSIAYISVHHHRRISSNFRRSGRATRRAPHLLLSLKISDLDRSFSVAAPPRWRLIGREIIWLTVCAPAGTKSEPLMSRERGHTNPRQSPPPAVGLSGRTMLLYTRRYAATRRTAFRQDFLKVIPTVAHCCTLQIF